MIRWRKHMAMMAGAFLCSFLAMGQEDVVSSEEMLVEQQNINFQTFFFESLQQKSIGNYDKAVYALEACNNIDKNNVAVLFELSKNYALLIKYTEAEYYILKGLEQDPDNLYMLRHLKEIKTKQNDYLGAIKIQNKIISLKPDEESDLVILYIKAGEIESATELLKKLDDNNKLPKGLRSLKESLVQDVNGPIEQSAEPVYEEVPKRKVDILKDDFNLKKDYSSLKLLLDSQYKSKQYVELLKDSEEGLSLFPAQPYLYLMNGRALNRLRKYKEAKLSLEEGLDYIIDDNSLKADIFEEISLSLKAMGDNKKASEYYNKAADLRAN
ncbi:tetratricopeptide repeat protein [Lutimonas sp.]|uniref:tetratricopeptide repeat protein n=1 Tax=Lutimonas sp. TaxID=1872403 RepID=UPI003D9BFC87